MHLFTYGSLMFPEVWSRVVRGSYQKQPVRLYGFQRRAIKGETYPAAIAAAYDYIDGQLYLNVSTEDMQRLDRFEGEDYANVEAPLTLANGDVVAVNLYLYRHLERLEVRDWDVAWFEREGMRLFLERYGGFAR